LGSRFQIQMGISSKLENSDSPIISGGLLRVDFHICP